jgi:hypothetical protein
VTPDCAKIRYRVDPADVPPEKAARRLHLTLERFIEVLPKLMERGFPPPDPDTGMFDLEAIDLWRRSRHSRAAELTGPPAGPQLVPDTQASMVERFVAAKERQTQKRRRDLGSS